jgi:hypothetical protein
VHRADRDASRLQVPDEPVGDRLRVDRPSERVAEHEIVVDVRRASKAPLKELRFAVAEQTIDRLGVECNGAL